MRGRESLKKIQRKMKARIRKQKPLKNLIKQKVTNQLRLKPKSTTAKTASLMTKSSRMKRLNLQKQQTILQMIL